MLEKAWSLLSIGILLLVFCQRTDSLCQRLTACSCAFSDGQGYDLSPLRNSRPLVAEDANHTFYFHPCENRPLSGQNGSECSKGNGVSLCLVHGKEVISLGTAEESGVVIGTGTSEPPALVFRHGSYKASIALACGDVHSTTRLQSDSAKDDGKEYHLTLVSPYACKTAVITKGLSTGSLLLIYLFVFTGIYFIGGAIALKVLRGATGWEMIPNHKFWRELPSLVRDGISFTLSGCRTTTYLSI